MCPIRLGQRVAFNRCLLTGETAQEYEPDGKAAQEIEALKQWISKIVHLSASKELPKSTVGKAGKRAGGGKVAA